MTAGSGSSGSAGRSLVRLRALRLLMDFQHECWQPPVERTEMHEAKEETLT